MSQTSTRNAIDTIKSLCIDAVFPPRCAGGTEVSSRCETWSHDLFCPPCLATLQHIEAPICALCGTPMKSVHAAAICAKCRDNRYHGAPPYDGIRSVYDYRGAIRPAIHRLKYKGKTALAEPLSQLLIEFLRTSSTRPCAPEEIELIVPVPLHPWRKWWRGFNQSELLARGVGCALGVPAVEMLRRTRQTPPQVELSREDRQQNVKDVFALRESARDRVRGATILLIDDVHTTGATLAECALILKNAGANRVFGLTLAHSL